MAKRNVKHVTRFARAVIRNQMIIALLLSVILLFRSLVAASSAFIGGLIVIIPNIVFMKIALGASETEQAMVTKIYVAEASKLLGATLFLFVTMKYFPGDGLMVLLGLIATLFANWLTPLFNSEMGRVI